LTAELSQAAAQPAPEEAAEADDAPMQDPVDPNAVFYRLEAWMPETIAIHKLRGFMQDIGGEVLESVPGHIRVRVGGPDGGSALGKSLSWLGRARKNRRAELMLRLERSSVDRQNLLRITVSMRPLNGESAFDPRWRGYTTQLFCDLRGYLMGQTGVVGETAS